MRRTRYKSNLLGNIQAHIAGLQGYGIMALELIQNADDAKAEQIVFDIRDNGLQVYNNAEFRSCSDPATDRCILLDQGHASACNFHCIAEVASSGKSHDPENIGHFGIGFISIYQITDHPEIRSAGYCLRLLPEEEAAEYTQENTPSGTTFWLPWASDPGSPVRRELNLSPITVDALEAMQADLQRLVHHALIFLRHVTQAMVKRNGKVIADCRIHRSPNKETLRIILNDREESWLVLSIDLADQAAELCKRYEPLQRARRKAHVTVALPLGSTGNTNDLDGLFYAFLPTEKRCGLPLHLNANFFPEADRKSIILAGEQHQRAWNEMLIRGAARLLAERIETLKQHLGPVRLWHLIDHAHKIAGTPPIRTDSTVFGTFWKAFFNPLTTFPSVWTSQHQWHKPSEAVLPPNDLSELELKFLHRIGPALVSRELRPFQNVLIKLGVRPLDLARLVEQLDATRVLPTAGAAVTSEQIKKLFKPLWSLIDRLLQSSRAETFVNHALPFLLTQQLTAVSIKEVLAVPHPIEPAKAAEALPFLSIAHIELRTHSFPHTYLQSLDLDRLVDELSQRISGPSAARKLLGSDASRLCRFYRLLADLANHARSDTTLARLAALPLFKTRGAFVSVNHAALPGDFQDPIGVAKVLDTSVLDSEAQVFLERQLGVERLSFPVYVRDHIPAYFAKPPTDLTEYQDLLEELARHGNLINQPELLAVLRNLAMLPTQAGGWATPSAGSRDLFCNRLFKMLNILAREIGADTPDELCFAQEPIRFGDCPLGVDPLWLDSI